MLREAILSLIMATFPHDGGVGVSTGSTTAPWYVRRVEDFIVAHARDDLSLDDMLQAAAGISARALHKGFRRY